jgi:hypothetical protein
VGLSDLSIPTTKIRSSLFSPIPSEQAHLPRQARDKHREHTLVSVFLSHLDLKMIIVPRQAQDDDHKEHYRYRKPG